jgi:cell division protein ZapA (FtsZ GTPase activity inhibitor)
MNEKKSYKVQIFEEHYVLVSDESEAFVLKAADMVDSFMKEISHQSNITDAKKIAVLSALRIAEMLLDFEREYTQKEQKKVALKDYIDQQLLSLSL